MFVLPHGRNVAPTPPASCHHHVAPHRTSRSFSSRSSPIRFPCQEYALLIRDTEVIKSEMLRVEEKVSRSTSLVSSLAEERSRWELGRSTFAVQLSTLVGDTLLAGAFLTYCGYFDHRGRWTLLSEWRAALDIAAIKFKRDVPMIEYLSTASERLAWKSNALPVDDLCTENAIIMSRFNRYPLIIDPSGQVRARSVWWGWAHIAPHHPHAQSLVLWDMEDGGVHEWAGVQRWWGLLGSHSDHRCGDVIPRWWCLVMRIPCARPLCRSGDGVHLPFPVSEAQEGAGRVVLGRLVLESAGVGAAIRYRPSAARRRSQHRPCPVPGPEPRVHKGAALVTRLWRREGAHAQLLLANCYGMLFHIRCFHIVFCTFEFSVVTLCVLTYCELPAWCRPVAVCWCGWRTWRSTSRPRFR